VEGGPRLWQAFLEAGLVDEVIVFRGADALGSDGVSALAGQGLAQLSEARGWTCAGERAVGRDVMTIYRSGNPVFML
jgi:diaminohydroxyphosphoribosylaminopyrimidine deaminase/5-amino-6-(5-phosphoribosylamino)uracil reductase